MAATSRLTIDDFERLPQEQVKNHELVDGELVDVSGNTAYHNVIKMLLIGLLLPLIRDRRLGTLLTEQEYDFDGNAHGPDVSFFGPEKRPLVEYEKRVQRFVPDLAIEIASANDTFSALLRKKERYRRCGTDEVWILAPETREVFVDSSRGDRMLSADAELSSELLPGFRVPVRRLFEKAANSGPKR
jgi:Uma2 family endonuclease